MDTVKVQSGNAKMVAHRGLSGIELENTCAAFVAAGNRGYYGIETDIQRTKDGVLVLHHDDTLERIPHVAGSVKDYTYDELLKMDFGAFKGECFSGERIVKLDTFLTHLAEHSFQNRTVGFIENGSWAPMAAKTMMAKLEKCKNITYFFEKVIIHS